MRFFNLNHRTDTATFSDYTAGSWQYSIGAKQFPEKKVESASQTWALLMQAAGLNGRDLQSVSLSGEEFVLTRFIIGMSFEKVPNVQFSGESTR